MDNKINEIKALIDSASADLEAARLLAKESGISGIHFYGPTYGMGGWIESGEWVASSGSC